MQQYEMQTHPRLRWTFRVVQVVEQPVKHIFLHPVRAQVSVTPRRWEQQLSYQTVDGAWHVTPWQPSHLPRSLLMQRAAPQ